jgi:starch-binding outer membrane protein, SusD/RagB family
VLIDSAVKILDDVIKLCDNGFTIPGTYVPTPEVYTNVELAGLANTLAARLLTYKSRNAAQNAANDWAKIKDYAANGIKIDFTVIMDDVTWYDYYKWYQIRDTWGRIDMRVINMLDPDMHPWFPASGIVTDLPNSGLASSIDSRLSYFEYLPSQNFYAERGIYHYSTYRLQRFDGYKDTRVGPLVQIMTWENDMIWAEALARTGDVAGAADILNDATGPRRSVGLLADVPAVLEDVLDAIYYEKTIECILSTENTEFYDMRRRDMLQAGTPLHLPIPAQQLEVLEIPFYSFGGTTGVAGVDYSTGGWELKPGFEKSEYGY